LKDELRFPEDMSPDAKHLLTGVSWVWLDSL
jgi:hypothetical protein